MNSLLTGALCWAPKGGLLLVLSAFAATAVAQTYPAKPIRLVVPYASGGFTDAAGRLVAVRLQKALGQPVVVDFKPGASGNIGAEAVAKSPPDGYTLMLTSNSFVVAPIVVKNTPFNPATDFTPVILLSTSPQLLVSAPNSQYKTVGELVAYAKANPGAVSIASGGNWTLSHLLGEWFKSEAGIKLIHIPYQGGAPAEANLLGGHVSLLFNNLLIAIPNVKSGRLRPLAVTGASRTPLLPDVPTMVESGFPGFTGFAWAAVLAPSGTPREIIDRLNDALNKGLQEDDMKQALTNLAMTPEGGPPERFTALYKTESERWTRLVKTIEIKE